MRVRTTDRANDIHTVDSVGRTREVTREGYLLCRDVRVARIGEMLYAPGELADDDGKEIEPGRDMIVRASRGPEELFRPETLASFNGKPVVVDHPDDDVNPDNWRELAGGIALNVRAGEGEDAGYMLADLLITDIATIKAIQDDEIEEISLGYDASYEQVEPGRARQFNILGNHFALVDRGRCGPRCAIGDSDMRTRDHKTASWQDKLRRAFRTRDEEGFAEAMEAASKDEMTNGVDADSGPGEHKIVLEIRGAGPNSATTAQEATADEGEEKKDLETKDDAEAAPAWFKSFSDDVIARLTALESARTSDEEGEKKDEEAEKTDDEELDMGDLSLEGTNDEEGEGEKKDEDEKEAGSTKDRATTTRDSSGLRAALTETQSRAEILLPGVRLPTFDSKDPAKRTLDRLCGFRRRVLARAYEDQDTRKLMAPLFGGRKPDFKGLTCDAASMMFNAASELAKASNSSVISGYIHDGGDNGKPATIADINAKNRDFWAGKGGLAK